MTAREGATTASVAGAPTFELSVIGPPGLRDRLATSFCFMGRMRFLRSVELTLEDAQKDV